MADQSVANSDLVTTALRRQAELETKRTIFESHLQEVAQRMLWREDIFFRRGPNSVPQGEKRSQKSFDSTATSANERFAAVLEAMLCPRSQKWHGLKPYSRAIEDDHDTKIWLAQVTDILFDARYSPRSNFAGQVGECFQALGAFGTASLFIDDALGSNLRYHSCHWTEMYFAENHVGLIDTAYRRYVMTARQMSSKWGRDNLGPGPVRALEKSPEQEFEVLHAVQPSTSIDYSRKDARGMAWQELYIDIASKKLMQSGGYQVFPYAISRYCTATREVYGRSPAMTGLADIKMLDEMSKTMIRIAQKMADPPILMPEDGSLQMFDNRSGALNYGGLDSKGEPMAKPFITGGQPQYALELLDQRRRSVESLFLADLWRSLVDHPNMTATQALMLAQERGILVAPTLGRQQSEFFGILIERELTILARAGQLPPMPDALHQSGRALKIEYTSPLNRLMRAQEGVGILTTMEQLAPLAQSHPEVFDIFDPALTARALAEINGAPESVLRSPEQLDALAQQRTQQQQAAALLQAAPVAASAAKDLSAAGATAQNAPQPQPSQPGVGI